MATFDDHSGGSPRRPNWSRINQGLLWVGLAVAVAWLFFRHGEHLSTLFPFFILLACPLMHLFGHGSHGGHGGHRRAGDEPPRDGESPPRRGSRHVH